MIYIVQHYDSNVLDTEGKCSIAMALVLGLKFINTGKKLTNSSVDFILICHDAHLFEHFTCLFEHFACLFGTIYCRKIIGGAVLKSGKRGLIVKNCRPHT